MIVPARIGRLTLGEVESIHLHEGGPAAAQLLLAHYTAPARVRWLIDHGDLLRLGDLAPVGAYGGSRPQVHADNNWPNDTAQCLYLYVDGTWWQRPMNHDGTFPHEWAPIPTT
jgi:hypothetical protein